MQRIIGSNKERQEKIKEKEGSGRQKEKEDKKKKDGDEGVEEWNEEGEDTESKYGKKVEN